VNSEDPFCLDLELPEGRDFIARPPVLTLEAYEAWCEEYWAAAEPRHALEYRPPAAEFVL
jgi:hypothetical protein